MLLLLQHLLDDVTLATLVVAEVLVRSDVAREAGHRLHVTRNDFVEVLELLRTGRAQTDVSEV